MPKPYTRKTGNLAMSWAFRQLPFWERVAAQIETNENGCHIFTGSKDDCGYGRINKDGKLVRLHRAVYEREHGWIPSGSVVMHKCDTPACINPEHLSLGTQVMNIKDMDRKGRRRSQVGSEHAHAKLTEKDIPVIRDRLVKGETCIAMSEDYPVCEEMIRAIKKNRAWTHVA